MLHAMTGRSGNDEARRVELTTMTPEQQRFEHLVLGRPRPPKIAQRTRSRGKKRTIKVDVVLAPDIEAVVSLREAWSHKVNATPETMQKHASTRPGALARLHQSGEIDDNQLAWAHEIAMIAEWIEADVKIGIGSYEPRIDQGAQRRVDGAAEGVNRARRQMAYTRWRKMLPMPKRLVLDMVTGEAIPYSTAARRYRLSHARVRKLLIAALDRWPECLDWAHKAVDQRDVDMLNERLG